MNTTMLFSAPGRTEIGGNHTDHQHGCVLAAAVDLEASARVTLIDEPVIRVISEGYPPVTVALNDLSPRGEERNTTAALVRGMAAAFAERGFSPVGFEARVTSTVLPGSGLSSSAAFEVLLGTVLNELCGGPLSPADVAIMGQWAENIYFGKPCGLMDQMASAVGGMVYMDFADPAHPLVEKLDFDFSAAGHALCILDSGASHADLTDDYASIPEELRRISGYFGQTVLRDVPEARFRAELPALRKIAGDRAVLRAIHFYEENRRAFEEAQALREGNFDRFLSLVRQSGQSSWMYLQNVIPAGAVSHQEMAVALALCHRLLGQRGAFRVHGGGFAGTVQAFVPHDLLPSFREETERILGEGACRVLSVREQGGIRIS